MLLKHKSLMGLIVIALANAHAAKLEMNLAPEKITGLRLLEQSPNRVLVECDVASISMEELILEGKSWNLLSMEGGTASLEKGAPDLPAMTISLAVGGRGIRSVTLVEEESQTLENMPVAPSRGSLSRLETPENAAWEFAAPYQSNSPWPAQNWSQSSLYQFRDVQGQSLRIQPFRYDPVEESLEVFTHLVLEIELDPAPAIDPQKQELDATFLDIYKNHFQNWGALSYDYLPSVGTMIVVCPDEWLTEIQPFVQWKNETGLPTTVVPISTTGATAAEIRTWLQEYWLAEPFTFVTLVGDVEQLPPVLFYGSASDPTLGMVLGTDNYPEAIIGRLPAGSVGDLQTMITRTIRYESEPQVDAEWYSRALGLASAEGPGDDGEYDWEHMENISQDLLAGDYTDVTRLYATMPDVGSSDVTAAIEQGVSLINYTGHGSWRSWSTPYYNNGYVNSLSNTDRWPVIIAVGCDNGAFNTHDESYAESWLRATHNGEPAGALAIYACTKLSSWSPPMEMQDEFNHLLANATSSVFGGLCINGSLSMVEQYQWGGPGELLTYSIFGDPSVQIRTSSPRVMDVVHPNSYLPESGTILINVPGEANALAALSVNGELASAAYTNAEGNVILGLPATGAPQEILLRVTARNAMPYEASIPQNREPQVVVPFEVIEAVEDSAITVTGIPGYFNDPDNDSISIVEVTASVTGFSFDIQGDDLVVVPPPEWSGTVVTTVSLTDQNYVIFADLEMHFSAVNDLPTLVNAFDNMVTVEDSLYTIVDPLRHFDDLDGPQSLSIENPESSTGTLTWDGEDLTLHPPANYFGTVQISFNVSDGEDILAVGPLTIDVLAVNDLPELDSPFGDLSMQEDSTLRITNPQQHFSDIDGETLALEAEFSLGSFVWDGQDLLYTAPENFNGAVTATISAADSEAEISGNSFTITVVPVEDQLELVLPFDSLQVEEGASLELTAILSHFNSLDTDSLHILSVSVAQEGFLTELNGDTLSLTPPVDYYGQTTVSISVSDAISRSELTVEIPLNVLAVNDSPWLDFCGEFEEPIGDFDLFLEELGFSFADVDNEELNFNWYLDGELLYSETRGTSSDTTWCQQAPEELADLLLGGILYLEIDDGEFLLNEGGSVLQWELASSAVSVQELPVNWYLKQNYPNPFNPTTTIEFGMQREGHVRLAIYNVRGQLVETLVDDVLPVGNHQEQWQAAGLASGVYLCVIQAQDFRLTRKMTLLR